MCHEAPVIPCRLILVINLWLWNTLSFLVVAGLLGLRRFFDNRTFFFRGMIMVGVCHILPATFVIRGMVKMRALVNRAASGVVRTTAWAGRTWLLSLIGRGSVNVVRLLISFAFLAAIFLTSIKVVKCVSAPGFFFLFQAELLQLTCHFVLRIGIQGSSLLLKEFFFLLEELSFKRIQIVPLAPEVCKSWI